MTEPTIKQVRYAEKLGIENPMNMSKEELSKAIDAKTGNKSFQNGSKPQNKAVSSTSEVINRTENADSIEWRLSTGKGVKVYCDTSKPEEAKQKLKNAIQILQDVEMEFQKPQEI